MRPESTESAGGIAASDMGLGASRRTDWQRKSTPCRSGKWLVRAAAQRLILLSRCQNVELCATDFLAHRQVLPLKPGCHCLRQMSSLGIDPSNS
jgi:hypothetical protein